MKSINILPWKRLSLLQYYSENVAVLRNKSWPREIRAPFPAQHTYHNREQTCGCKAGWRRGGLGGLGEPTQTVLCRMDKQVLLCGTGDHTPYAVTHHSQKNIEKKGHAQTTESLGCTAEINTSEIKSLLTKISL